MVDVSAGTRYNAHIKQATGDKMEAETIVIEWDIPVWLQAELDWWEANPAATEAEFEASFYGFIIKPSDP